MIKISVT